jgi:hypothetical protein
MSARYVPDISDCISNVQPVPRETVRAKFYGLGVLYERLSPNLDKRLLERKRHQSAETLLSSEATLLSSLTIRQFGHLAS